MGDVHAELGQALEQRRASAARRRCRSARMGAAACPAGLRVPDGHRQHRRRGAEVGRRPTRACAARSDSAPSRGRHRWMPPTAVTAQLKHQPLQWNIGSVQRNTESRSTRHVQRHRQRLQIGAAVVIHHALRTRRRAAGVVDREQARARRRPAAKRGGCGDQRLELVTRAAGADHAQSGVNGGRGLLRGWHEFGIADQDRAARVLEDVRRVGRRDARVERDQRGARRTAPRSAPRASRASCRRGSATRSPGATPNRLQRARRISGSVAGSRRR